MHIPPNLPIRITYADGTFKDYMKCIGFSGDGMKFEDENGDIVVDNRPYLEISVQTDSGWQKVT